MLPVLLPKVNTVLLVPVQTVVAPVIEPETELSTTDIDAVFPEEGTILHPALVRTLDTVIVFEPEFDNALVAKLPTPLLIIRVAVEFETVLAPEIE